MFVSFICLGVIVVSVILIFFSALMPRWLCDYVGHMKPIKISRLKNSGSIIIGKCQRCEKLVQNDTHYPNDVWY